ncbi:hypothetical protein DFH06DRAFT_1150562 [Mycena polygramma]|nr:hypothetical protein DFH06DRAFT_1150562 [Mycena polygramma]
MPGIARSNLKKAGDVKASKDEAKKANQRNFRRKVLILSRISSQRRKCEQDWDLKIRKSRWRVPVLIEVLQTIEVFVPRSRVAEFCTKMQGPNMSENSARADVGQTRKSWCILPILFVVRASRPSLTSPTYFDQAVELKF